MVSTETTPKEVMRYRGMLALNGSMLFAPSIALALIGGSSASSPRMAAGGLMLSALLLLLPMYLVRSWRGLFLLHLPLLSLSPLFVWYVLNFSAPPDENAFTVLLTSPPAELFSFAELFQLEWPALGCMAGLLLYAGIAIRLGRRAIPARARRAVLWMTAPLLVVPLCLPSRTPNGWDIDLGENVHDYLSTSYPLGALTSLVGGVAGNIQAWGFFDRTEPYHAQMAISDGTPRTHILVIGESARADHFHLLGYPRQTTPELERLDGLLAFTRTFSTGNLTLLAVPMMMTGSAPASYSPQGIRGNLVDLANESGFFTAWLSNQSMDLYKIFRPRPSVWRQPVDTNQWADRNPTPDDLLLAPLDDVLKNPSPRKFIVMHTYGSHWDYTQRLPDKGFFFSGRDRQSVAAAIKADKSGRVAADAYDDTILHTDYVLNQIIQRASRLPGQVTLTYIPDHGEALTAEEGRATHGFKDFNVSEVHIPLLFWANAAFRQAHDTQWQALAAHKDQVVRQDSIFYTTASLLGIEFPAQDARRDLTSPAFQPIPVRQLQFRIAGSSEVRHLRDALDWPHRCAALAACD